MQAAIYARKSPVQHGVAGMTTSVTRQIEHARAYADRKGWTVADDQIYLDDRISGAEFEKRPGYMRLLNALKPRAPFEVLIVSELSRLGREQLETGYLLKQLSQAGVRVYSHLEDREVLLDTPTDKFLMSAVSFAAEIERDKARQRTYDAMVRKAKAGHVTGGVVFGYDNVRLEGGPVVRRINEAEAEVVREIFALYASGVGVRGIAKRLNAQDALCPRPRGTGPRGWASSSVWAVVNRPLYRGEIVWGQTKKRNHWGERATSTRDENEWVRVSAPDLRIVPEQLCQAVETRRHDARRAYLTATKGERFGRPAHGFESKYLLTGLARCGCCGGSLVVRSRSHGRRRASFYACSAFHHRGHTVCANGLDAPMRAADDAILEEIEGYVLHPDVIERALALAIDELRPKTGRVEDERGRLRTEIRTVEQELERLTTALATGGDLPSVLSAIQAREHSHADLTERFRSLERVRDFTAGDAMRVERQLRAKLSDWRGLLRGEVQEARQILRALLQDRIEFTPSEQDGHRIYRYRGTFTIGPLLAGVLDPQALASPTGFEPVS